MARTFTVLTVVSAVSAEEKKADSINREKRITSCMTPGVSKKTTPLIKILCLQVIYSEALA